MEWVWAIGTTLLGAAVGSFLNVCIHRLPRGESLVLPSSHCPRCGQAIAWRDNIPVLSYLLLKGRCRRCRQAISGRYPLVEALTAILALGAYVKFGFSLAFGVVFLFLAVLVAIVFIDLEHQIIPHELVLPGIPVFLLSAVFVMDLPFLESFLGLVIGISSLYLIAVYYEALTGNEGMGGGDVNLMGMLGAFLGWKSLLFILMVAAGVGTVVGVTLMIGKDKSLKYAVPFGPFLSLGAVLYLFWGKDLLRNFLYLS